MAAPAPPWPSPPWARSSPVASPPLLLAAFAPPLAEVAFKFGQPEYFSLMVLGLVGAVVLASGSLPKAIAMIILGLLLGMVGTDVNSGVARYDFGIPELQDGIDFAIVAMGVFGFAEIMTNLEQKENRVDITDKIGSLYPNFQEFRKPPGRGARHRPGFGPGHPAGRRRRAVLVRLPTRSGRRSPKNPERFGKGHPAGLAGPESANNAAAQTSFIPLLTLGIPGNAVMALMVGAMTIHNIQPGPQVMTSHPRAVLGPDRLDVDRQPDAGGAEPAADRPVGQAAESALPHPVPGHPGVLHHRRVLVELQHVRHLHDRGLRRGGLRGPS